MLEVIQAKEEDIDVLSRLGKETFYETFHLENSDEDMNNYLETAFSYEKIKSEITNNDSLFFIAYVDNQASGYLKVNFNKYPKILDKQSQTLDLTNYKVMELQRIYILKSFIGKKVGKALMEKSMEIARTMNAEYIWLGVAENNYHAQDFYKKWGFKIFGNHIFKTGEKVETDLLMYLRI